MKKILIIIALSSLTLSAFARGEDDGFITYRKPLLPGLSLTQTDDTTSIIYRGRAIKTYQNKEFSIELLPHGPNEDPDCYNSLKRDIPATRAKNIIGKDYLRSCFILRSEVIRGRYILLYSPSVEGNRVSIYDIRAKKYYHHIMNTVLSYVMARDRTLIFLSGNSQSPCERSLVAFRGGETKMLFDGCSLTKSGWPLIQIGSYRVVWDMLSFWYFVYQTLWYDSILDTSREERMSLSLSWVITSTPYVNPKNTVNPSGGLFPSTMNK